MLSDRRNRLDTEGESDSVVHPAATGALEAEVVEEPRAEKHAEGTAVSSSAGTTATSTSAAKHKAPARHKPTFSGGVQAWFRGESRFNPDFDAADKQHAAQLLERIRLEGRGTYGPVSAFAQAQDARVWGFEGSTVSNEGNLDLHQGFVNLGGEHRRHPLNGWVRLGRQEVVWGQMRLIGHLPWAPEARSFDALRVHGEYKMVGLDAFAALLNRQQEFEVVGDTATRKIRTNGSALGAVQFFGHFHDAINLEALFLMVDLNAVPSAQTRDMLVMNPGRGFGENRSMVFAMMSKGTGSSEKTETGSTAHGPLPATSHIRLRT